MSALLALRGYPYERESEDFYVGFAWSGFVELAAVAGFERAVLDYIQLNRPPYSPDRPAERAIENVRASLFRVLDRIMDPASGTLRLHREDPLLADGFALAFSYRLTMFDGMSGALALVDAIPLLVADDERFAVFQRVEAERDGFRVVHLRDELPRLDEILRS